MDALKARQSARTFAPDALAPQVLSNLLWATNGVNRPDGRRTAPSARNWQEIDVYVVMTAGAYVYDAGAHSLKPVAAGDHRAKTGTQAYVNTAPVNLVYVADFAKTGQSPAEERDLFTPADAGFIAQNAYLFCASEGLAVVVRGLIDRPALAKALNLRPDRGSSSRRRLGTRRSRRTRESPSEVLRFLKSPGGQASVRRGTSSVRLLALVASLAAALPALRAATVDLLLARHNRRRSRRASNSIGCQTRRCSTRPVPSRCSCSASTRAVPRLDLVLAQEAVLGLETVPSMAGRSAAVAAINAGFFLPTGEPAGLLKIDGELVSDVPSHRGAVALLPGRFARAPRLLFDQVRARVEIDIGRGESAAHVTR